MKYSKPRWFVGHLRARIDGRDKIAFRTNDDSERTNGRRFFALIGPFRTRRAAEYMAAAGPSPTCLSVNDAEELSRPNTLTR
jgi:hypothetical protein